MALLRFSISETAGALGYGETIFITAKLPEHIRVGRDDLIDNYLFLTSTHNGTGCITIAFTPVRIWCSNTLNAALRNCTNAVNIRHTASAEEKLKSAHKMLGLSDQLTVELEAIFNRWARVRITDPQVKRLIQLAMIPNKETYQKLKTGQEAELSSHYNNMVSSVFDYAMTANRNILQRVRCSERIIVSQAIFRTSAISGMKKASLKASCTAQVLKGGRPPLTFVQILPNTARMR
ncbi:uncharacterized protein DUF932 [Mucilaginibacter gracilis]|uniref:Uncharacterized protein DUF932 n=1 Tax=Mucilaginibacter gracilis TaxID=423350 RepID=A0A495J380_9SPHI|nr:uncharacterized protein DUF932 [Mucilaginibacter gracilis]